MAVHKMKLARVAREMSQEDLAKSCGVTRQTIGLIEAGKFNPSLALCIKIAKNLESTLDALFWPQEEGE